jgi:hypothetical protein
VDSVLYAVSLLLASLCYFLINQLMFYNNFIFGCFVFLFSLSCFSVVLCIVSICLFHFYNSTSLALQRGGNQIAVNRYRNVTYY